MKLTSILNSSIHCFYITITFITYDVQNVQPSVPFRTRVANFQKMKFGTRRLCAEIENRDAVGVEGYPLPSRLENLGERRELPSGVRGGAPAENEFGAY